MLLRITKYNLQTSLAPNESRLWVAMVLLEVIFNFENKQQKKHLLEPRNFFRKKYHRKRKSYSFLYINIYIYNSSIQYKSQRGSDLFQESTPTHSQEPILWTIPQAICPNEQSSAPITSMYLAYSITQTRTTFFLSSFYFSKKYFLHLFFVSNSCIFSMNVKIV